MDLMQIDGMYPDRSSLVTLVGFIIRSHSTNIITRIVFIGLILSEQNRGGDDDDDHHHHPVFVTAVS